MVERMVACAEARKRPRRIHFLVLLLHAFSARREQLTVRAAGLDVSSVDEPGRSVSPGLGLGSAEDRCARGNQCLPQPSDG